MLKINEKYQIREFDELNYGLYELRIVENKKTKERRMDWVRIGYFGQVSHALYTVLNRYVKESIGEEDYDCSRLYKRIEMLKEELLAVDVIHEPKIKPVKGMNVKKKKREQKKEKEEDDKSV